MKDVALVRDVDGNELFLGETIGECRDWCTKNSITGINGEYIAFGTFYEDSRYFNIEDYEEI